MPDGDLFPLRFLLPIWIKIRSRLLFWLVGFVGLFGTLWGWVQVNTSMEANAQDRFQNTARNLTLQIETRLQLYERCLRGVAALYAASKDVDRDEFHAYIQSLNLSKKYPGLIGITYNQWVPESKRPLFLKQLSPTLFPRGIFPPGLRPQSCVVTYIEPQNSKNLSILGMDIYANPERQEAVDQAILTGNLSVTHQVELVNHPNGNSRGCLFIFPIFQKTKAIETEIQRREATEGVVVAIFQINKLMEELESTTQNEIQLNLSEMIGTSCGPIYQQKITVPPPPAFHPYRYLTQLQVANRQWSLTIQTLPAFHEKISPLNARYVLAAGLTITVLLLIGVLREWINIERNRRSAGALLESERRFQALTEIAPVGIFRTDAAGQCNYINPQAAELLGVPPQLALQSGWHNALHPEDRERVLKSWSEAVEKKTLFLSEYRFQRPDGTISWVLGRALCECGPEGEVKGFIGTLTDITERRRLLEEQLKISKLESIGVLAGGIAHDFNNLLTPILANLSFLKSMIPASDASQEYLIETEQASFRARDLTHQLLTFSKGGTPIKRASHLRDLIQESIRFALHGRNVTPDFQIAPDLNPVDADAGQISQVLQNLAINAAQAMNQGGQLHTRAFNTTGIDHPTLPHKNGSFIRIDIQDTGAGISPKNLTKIFDPYFTTKTEGHGLGLATVFSIIHRHEGLIGVTSELGKGTTFSIFLPASTQTPKPSEQPDALLHHGKGKILVMDDEKEIRSTVDRVLTKLGYEVSLASNGEEAIHLFEEAVRRRSFFNAALMDLTIRGGMGGKDAAAQIKLIDPSAKLIVFSGYSEDPVMAHYRDFGFSAAIPKPFTAQTLSEVLKETLKSPPLSS